MSKRGQKLKAELGAFLQQYARKAHAGHDPNDRQYDRRMEARVKRMRPEEFDALLHDEMSEEAAPNPEA